MNVHQEVSTYKKPLLIRTAAQEIILTSSKHTSRFWQITAVFSDVRSVLRLGLINNSLGLITALYAVADPRVPWTALNNTQLHCLSDKCCNAMRTRYFRKATFNGYLPEGCPTTGYQECLKTRHSSKCLDPRGTTWYTERNICGFSIHPAWVGEWKTEGYKIGQAKQETNMAFFENASLLIN
jgi:hypothetical protein